MDVDAENNHHIADNENRHAHKNPTKVGKIPEKNEYIYFKIKISIYTFNFMFPKFFKHLLIANNSENEIVT